MQERITARAILLNPNNELLLARVLDPSVTDPDNPQRGELWCTIGGRVEPEEELVNALQRELEEECGLIPSSYQVLGLIWHGEQVLIWKGERTLLKESFFLVRSRSSAINTAGQTSEERQVVKELRWWSMDELESTQQILAPACLRTLLPKLVVEVAQGKPPEELQSIELSL